MRASTFLFSLSVLGAVAVAQPPADPPPTIQAGAGGLEIRSAAFVATLDGEGLRLVGVRDGAWLSFRLTAFGRGQDVRPVVPGAVEVVSEPGRISYRRHGVVEEYLPHRLGVKQNFVFTELPAGSGDLVVRGTVDTPLSQQRSSCDLQLRSDAHVDGLRIGAVVGVDGAGRRVPGSMSLTRGVLELRLPAEFVDSAELPLVLDPLIGVNQLVGTNQPPQFGFGLHPSVCHDPINDRYFSVWDHGDGTSIWSRFLDGEGNATGAMSFLLPRGGFFFYMSEPKVTWVEGPNPFVVAANGFFCFTPTTLVSTVDNNGVASVESNLPPWDLHAHHDIGGGPGGETAVIVIENWDRNTIELAEYHAPSRSTTRIVTLASDGRKPAIAATGGSTNRYLVVWQDRASEDYLGAIVSRMLDVLEAPFFLASGASAIADIDVDGDGSQWVVSYGRSGDVLARTVSYPVSTGVLTLGDETVVAGTASVERHPSVAWVGESYLVAYEKDFGGGDFDVWVASIESFGCAPCEGVQQISTSGLPDTDPGIASRGAGGTRALIQWGTPTEASPTTRARHYAVEDGTVTDLGGGCGGGGIASATCAGSPGRFGLRTTGAAAGAPGALLLGAAVGNLPCGPCGIVPVPLASVPVLADAVGTAEIGFDLVDPALVGGRLVVQFLIAAPGGCGPVLSFSNGLDVVIE